MNLSVQRWRISSLGKQKARPASREAYFLSNHLQPREPKLQHVTQRRVSCFSLAEALCFSPYRLAHTEHTLQTSLFFCTAAASIVPSTRQDHQLNANRPHTPPPPPTRSTYAIHHEQHTRNSLGGDSDTALLHSTSYHPAVYHSKHLSIAGARNIHNGSFRHDARTSDCTAVLLLARLATQHLDHHHVGNRRHISRSLCEFRSNTECTRRVGHTMVRLHLIHRSIALIFCCFTGRWGDIGSLKITLTRNCAN